MDRFDRTPYRPDSETWDQYVIRAGLYTEHRVCVCCMIIIANGDPCGQDDCDTCREGGQFEKPFDNNPGHLSIGAFTDKCGHDLRDDTQGEEHVNGCERHGFTWSACTWCGVNLGGDRYSAVFWPAKPAEVNDMAPGGVSWE